MLKYDDGIFVFEFYSRLELCTPGLTIDFNSTGEALSLLHRAVERQNGAVVLLRELLAVTGSSPVRLSDREVLEAAAGLIRSRRVLVGVRKKPNAAAAVPVPGPERPVPFPLSQRRPRTPSAPPPSPPVEPTFSPKVDFAAQGAVLQAAAQSGAPFCPERPAS
jgi:hypothetical protein